MAVYRMNRFARGQQQPSPSGAPSADPNDLINQLANDFGIDPSQLQGGAADDPYRIFSEGADVEDQVGVGHRQRPMRPGPPTGRGRERGRQQAGTTQLLTSSVGDLLRGFYELDPSLLRHTQALLYAGGFYGDMDVTDVQWSQYDEETFAAYARLIERTARMNAAGQNITYKDVLAQAASDSGVDPDVLATDESGNLLATDEELERALAETEDVENEVITKEGDVIDILLSDPNGLRSTIDRSAGAVLGRKATPAEQRMFISMIHNVQRDAQRALQTAEPGKVYAEIPGGIAALGATDAETAAALDQSIPDPEDVTVEYAAPDEAAVAEQLLRQQNPGEAGAHDIAIQFANFLDLLNAPVDVPRVTAGGGV